MNVASYAKSSLDLARTLKGEAGEAEANGNFAVAESLLTASLNKFKESIQIASVKIEKQAESAKKDLAIEKMVSKSPATSKPGANPTNLKLSQF